MYKEHYAAITTPQYRVYIEGKRYKKVIRGDA